MYVLRARVDQICAHAVRAGIRPTASAIAGAIGRPPSTIAALFAGDRQPSGPVIAALCAVLNATQDEFFEVRTIDKSA